MTTATGSKGKITATKFTIMILVSRNFLDTDDEAYYGILVVDMQNVMGDGG